MDSSIAYLDSIAASGNSGAIVLARSSYKSRLSLRFACEYDAMAGTSGVSFAITASTDGGSTYNSLPGVGAVVVKPSATAKAASQEITLPFEAGLQNVNGTITNVKVIATNLDATNAAVTLIEAQFYAAQ